MTTRYERLRDAGEVWCRIADIAPRAIIVDVEPLVAYWGTDLMSHDAGIASVLESLGDVTSIEVIVFAANSVRRPSAIANGRPDTRVLYYAAARKPLRTKPYRSLPRPGLIVGDLFAR